MAYELLERVEERELIKNLIKFNEATVGNQKNILGRTPKYYLHCVINGEHIFGLSKFCAVKKITVDDYLKVRKLPKQKRKLVYPDGTKTQNRIIEITKIQWQPFAKVEDGIKLAFEQWLMQINARSSFKFSANIITIPVAGTVQP